jgi:hypothetical protein
MALLAAGRVAMHRLNRPQHSLNLYQAASDSATPHMDLDPSIQMGIKAARAALGKTTAAAAATAGR